MATRQIAAWRSWKSVSAARAMPAHPSLTRNWKPYEPAHPPHAACHYWPPWPLMPPTKFVLTTSPATSLMSWFIHVDRPGRNTGTDSSRRRYVPAGRRDTLGSDTHHLRSEEHTSELQ